MDFRAANIYLAQTCEPNWRESIGGAYALNSETREEKIIRYLPLVKYIAGRIAIGKGAPVDVEDLYGYGVIGLIDAIDRFDAAKGVKFETYASFRIKGAIIDELRKLSWMPRTAIAKVAKLNETRDSLKASLGREPLDNEIADALNMPLEEMRKIENYINYLSFVSLDEVLFQPDDEKNAVNASIEDRNSPRPDNIIEDRERFIMLKKAIDLLGEKDKLVLNLYYNEKMTLKEIGRVLNVTESRVSQLHSRAILRLRENLRKLNYSL